MKKIIAHTRHKIQRNVALVFLIAASAIAFFVILVTLNNSDASSTENLVAHTYRITKYGQSIQSTFAESESATRGFLMTGNDHWKQAVQETHIKITKELAEVSALAIDTVQKKRLAELKQLIATELEFQERIISIDTINSNHFQLLKHDGEERQQLQNINATLGLFMDRQSVLLEQRSQANFLAKRRSLLTVIIGTALVFFFITGTLIRLNRDIRRRKLAEEDIRESEHKYRMLIEGSGVTIFTANLQGDFTYVSGRSLELTGYTAEELMGKNFAFLVEMEWINVIVDEYQEQLKNGWKETTIEFPIQTSNKKEKWVEQHAVLLFDDNYAPIGFQCMVKDITEKKETALRATRSEAELQVLLNSTREGFFLVNAEFEILLMNKQAQKTMEALNNKKINSGMNILPFIPATARDRITRNLEKVFAGAQLDDETRLDTPLGIQWIRASYSPVLDENGLVIGAAIVTHDITDKRLQEEKLRQSEYRFRTTLEKLGDNVWEHDFRTNQTYFSETGYQFLGYHANEFESNVNLWWDSTHPEDRHMLEENDRKYKAGITDQHALEYRMICKDGTVKWVLDRGVVIDKKSNGTALKILGTHTDITELKVAGEKLRESDHKIRAMLESTGEGFYMIGPDYTVQMINDAGNKSLITVIGKECKKGDHFLKFIRPERKNIFLNLFQSVLNGKTEENEVQMDTIEGEKWFQNSYFPLRNEKNEIMAVCMSSKDITERKLTEKALNRIRAEREEYQFRLQSILDNTPLVIFVKNLEGRYLLINKSFRELVQLQESDIIGKTDFEFDDINEAIRYQKVDEKVIRTLQSVESEETIDGPEGTRHLLLVKFPLFDKNGSIYGVGCIATDYTDKVEYRQKLIEARKKAESAEHLQEQFLANMSHEIRTPMNGIIGMTNILADTPLDNEQKEFVNIIRQSSNTLLYLINDVLDLSKIKSGKLALEKTSFHLGELLKTTMAPFSIKADEKAIILQLVQDESAQLQLVGDPYRLRQVLNNLLSNAMKFTEKGSVILDVKKTAQVGDGISIQFTVNDTGIGIAQTKLASIFNSFEQASSSTTRQYGGTGLGLSITKQLVEIQGGNIEVSSRLNEGSSFQFTIQYQLAEVQEKLITLSNTVWANATDLINKKILVVEDNEVNQKVILHILKTQGIKVSLAHNGREAVELLEQGQSFDLIIMDLQMPELDGMQTTVYIRNKLNSAVPIIAMTASALRNERQKCFELGMNEYLTKPFSPADLFAKLRHCLFNQQESQANDKGAELKNGNEFYNLSFLQEMEDNEYSCEVLQLFLDTTPVLLDEIKESVLHEQWDTVHKKAHKLKSSLGILQMNSMLELVTVIEQQAKEQKETELVPAGLKRLTEQLSLVKPMIEAELLAARQSNN